MTINFNERFKAVLAEKNTNINQLRLKMDLGMGHLSMVAKRGNLTSETIVSIARHLDVTVGHLLYGDDTLVNNGSGDLKTDMNRLANAAGVTIYRVCKDLGMSSAAMYNLLRKNNAKLQTMERFANYFNVPVTEFIK